MFGEDEEEERPGLKAKKVTISCLSSLLSWNRLWSASPFLILFRWMNGPSFWLKRLSNIAVTTVECNLIGGEFTFAKEKHNNNNNNNNNNCVYKCLERDCLSSNVDMGVKTNHLSMIVFFWLKYFPNLPNRYNRFTGRQSKKIKWTCKRSESLDPRGNWGRAGGFSWPRSGAKSCWWVLLFPSGFVTWPVF